MESGILPHWKKESVSAEVKKFKEKEEKRSENIDNEEETNPRITDLNISIYQLQSAFYLNISAIFISMALLIWEILSNCIKYKHSTKKYIFC